MGKVKTLVKYGYYQLQRFTKSWKSIIVFFKKVFDFFYLSYFGVDTKFGYVKLIGLPIIKKHPDSVIKLGKGITLVSKSSGNVAGINHPIILSTLQANSFIQIDGPFGASGSAIVSAKGIKIKKNSGIGANSSVYDTDFHPVNPAQRLQGWGGLDFSEEVEIGENVWIAANCIVLKGVIIGNNSVIGAGSIVTRSVPQNTLFAGNPAKKIKDI